MKKREFVGEAAITPVGGAPYYPLPCLWIDNPDNRGHMDLQSMLSSIAGASWKGKMFKVTVELL